MGMDFGHQLKTPLGSLTCRSELLCSSRPSSANSASCSWGRQLVLMQALGSLLPPSGKLRMNSGLMLQPGSALTVSVICGVNQ